MKDSVILEGKIYISAKRAAKIINYAQDYIGQLCRSGKLDCKMIGRSWFVTEESLLAHRADAIDNTEVRVLKAIKNNDVATKETIKAVVEKKIELPVSAAVVSVPITPEAPKVTKLEVKKEKVEEKVVEKKVAPAIPSLIAKTEVKAPIVSPIQPGSLKYETENKSLLPELKKKVPAAFEMPKKNENVLALAPAPLAPSKRISVQVPHERRVEVRTSAPTAALAVEPAGNFATTIVVILVALSGFFFTLSLASHSNKSLSYGNEASVGSAAKELVSEILKSIGIKGRSPTVAVNRDTIQNPAPAQGITAGKDNGISIFPATTPDADELTKQKILNTFSDEVSIKPDQSGRAGVITPVFRKTNGTDFVYVMVPVEEQKQQ